MLQLREGEGSCAGRRVAQVKPCEKAQLRPCALETFNANQWCTIAVALSFSISTFFVLFWLLLILFLSSPLNSPLLLLRNAHSYSYWLKICCYYVIYISVFLLSVFSIYFSLTLSVYINFFKYMLPIALIRFCLLPFISLTYLCPVNCITQPSHVFATSYMDTMRQQVNLYASILQMNRLHRAWYLTHDLVFPTTCWRAAHKSNIHPKPFGVFVHSITTIKQVFREKSRERLAHSEFAVRRSQIGHLHRVLSLPSR